MSAFQGMLARPTCTQPRSLLRQRQMDVPRCIRPVVVKALPNDSGMDKMARLFDQHKLLMGSGFSYDQASLILRVSQQRKAVPSQLAGGAIAASPEPNTTGTPDPAATAGSGGGAAADGAGAVDSKDAFPPALKTLEERISFLELELLKQALAAAPTNLADTPPGGVSNSSGAGGVGSNSIPRSFPNRFNSTSAALNPAAAGASALNAAAAAAAGSWNADATMYRQPMPVYVTERSSSSGISTGPPGSAAADPFSVTAQLAAAAELGQLDPEVYALAEALAVRQGLAGLPAGTPPSPYALSPAPQQQQQQQRRPSRVWDRSAHKARPLSAHAWGDALYDPEYGQPLLTRQDCEEEVPYQPSGWAVAGTIVVVYLGVIVTFLALCVGDVPY